MLHTPSLSLPTFSLSWILFFQEFLKILLWYFHPCFVNFCFPCLFSIVNLFDPFFFSTGKTTSL